MEFFIDDIVNKHQDQPAIVMGHGPSCVPVISKLPELKETHVLISCNQWFKFFDTQIDYWVVASSELSVSKQTEIFNAHKNSKTKLIYADSVDTFQNNEWNKQHLFIDYMRYSERPPVSDSIQINPFYRSFTNSSEDYKAVGTVALHMLSFAVIMGCNPIYITGVDLDHNKGYALNKRPTMHSTHPYVQEMDTLKNMILEQFEIIVSGATNIGTKIYGCGNQPEFNLFKRAEL